MENKNVFNETVETLTKDVKSLTERYCRLLNQGDSKSAIDTLRLLKDTLSLIKEYDWHLEYSEYKTDGQKQVSVWEQNHCGDIRNHKIWDVSNKKNGMKNKWEDLLRVFIENKQSMLYELSYDKDAEKEHRGTGKSTAIEKLAVEYDLSILTTDYRAKNFNKQMCLRQFKNKTCYAYSSYNSFRGHETIDTSEIILADEGFVDSDMYKDLIENYNYIIIGFKAVK